MNNYQHTLLLWQKKAETYKLWAIYIKNTLEKINISLNEEITEGETSFNFLI
jgi:hypothetical protein